MFAWLLSFLFLVYVEYSTTLTFVGSVIGKYHKMRTIVSNDSFKYQTISRTIQIVLHCVIVCDVRVALYISHQT